MSRKKFIESHGATCRNWLWSWSFVNLEKRFVIFGAWDECIEGDRQLILEDDWKKTSTGRNAPGFNQSIEHIRLIEEEGFQLYTFRLFKSDPNADRKGAAAKLWKIEKILRRKLLVRDEENRRYLAVSMGTSSS